MLGNEHDLKNFMNKEQILSSDKFCKLSFCMKSALIDTIRNELHIFLQDLVPVFITIDFFQEGMAVP